MQVDLDRLRVYMDCCLALENFEAWNSTWRNDVSVSQGFISHTFSQDRLSSDVEKIGRLISSVIF